MSSVDSDEAPELVRPRSSRPSVHWSDDGGDLRSDDGTVDHSRLDGLGPSNSSKSSKGKRSWKDYLPGRGDGRRLKRKKRNIRSRDSDTEDSGSEPSYNRALSNRTGRSRRNEDSGYDSGYPDSEYENERSRKKSVSFSPTTEYSNSTRPTTTRFTASPPTLINSNFDDPESGVQWPRLTEVKHHKDEQSGATTTIIRFGEEDSNVDMDVGGLRIRYNRIAKAGGGNVHHLHTGRAAETTASSAAAPLSAQSEYQQPSVYTPPPSPPRPPTPRPSLPETSTTRSAPHTFHSSSPNHTTTSSIPSNPSSRFTDSSRQDPDTQSSSRQSTSRPIRTEGIDTSNSSRPTSRRSQRVETDQDPDSPVPLAYDGRRKLDTWWTDLTGYDLDDQEVLDLYDERLATTAKSMRTIDDIYSFNSTRKSGKPDNQSNRQDRFKAAQWLTDRLMSDKDSGHIEHPDTDISTWINSTLDDLDTWMQDNTNSSIRPDQDGEQPFKDLANWSLSYNPSEDSLGTYEDGRSLAIDLFDQTRADDQSDKRSNQDKRSHRLFEMFNTMDSLATHEALRGRDATYTDIPDTELSAMASEILDGGGDQQAFDHVLDEWYKDSANARR